VPRSKNEWSYTSTPQYAFMTWCLVKHRDNFTFTFTFTFGEQTVLRTDILETCIRKYFLSFSKSVPTRSKSFRFWKADIQTFKHPQPRLLTLTPTGCLQQNKQTAAQVKASYCIPKVTVK